MDTSTQMISRFSAMLRRCRLPAAFTGRGCIGGACGSGAWGEHQSGVLLAQAVSVGTTRSQRTVVAGLNQAPEEGADNLARREYLSSNQFLCQLRRVHDSHCLRQAQVRIDGSADPELLRVLLECLGR